MNEKLNHLSEEQIHELMDSYYSGVSATKLLSEYKISITPSKLYTTFPCIKQEEYNCNYCGSCLVLDRVSKQMQNSQRYERDLYCPNCFHKPYLSICNCDNSQTKKLELKEQQLNQIKDVYSQEKQPVAFAELPFRTKIYLGAVCRELLSENLNTIIPEVNSRTFIAPTEKFLNFMYKDIIKHNAIVVSPLSDFEAFDHGDDNFPYTYYTNKVTYNLNIDYSGSKEDLISDILNPKYYEDCLSTEAYGIWKEIAVEECIQYLIFQLNSVGFSFNAGEKTYILFNTLLENFSVSQIYGIIWRSVANASKLYLERTMTKIMAANSVIGSCRRYAETAVLNKWDLRQYSRLQDLPQSVLSEFFFNKVLKIGDIGFRMTPSNL